MYDVAIILPSRNEEATIAAVTTSVDIALGDAVGVIVNADHSDNRKTERAFKECKTRNQLIYLPCDRQGKGYQIFQGIEKISSIGGARYYLCFDTDNKKPTPDIYSAVYKSLGGGADYAIIEYRRWWLEGNFTNHIARPLLLALSGVDLPQPISGDFGVRAELLENVLSVVKVGSDDFVEGVNGYGVDILFSLCALLNGFNAESIRVNVTKDHAPSFPHMRDIFYDAICVLFSPMWKARPLYSLRNWSGEFRLDEHPDLMRANHIVEGLKGFLSNVCGDNFLQPLSEAWSKEEVQGKSAADALWELYVRRVIIYLCRFNGRPVKEAENFLKDALMECIRCLASVKKPN